MSNAGAIILLLPICWAAGLSSAAAADRDPFMPASTAGVGETLSPPAASPPATEVESPPHAGGPLSNRLVTLQYADAREVAKNIRLQKKDLMTPRGNVMADPRTNSLVLRDTAEALDSLQDWIDIWDQHLDQVMITAHIVTISRDNLREIGVNWSYPSGAGGRLDMMSLHLPLGEHYARSGFRLARLGGRVLELELTALEQENKVDILASPRLYTSHMQKASIKQGTEIPYQVSSGRSRGASIQFKEAVLSMEVTPRMLRNGRITLDLSLSQNVPGRLMKQGENESVSIDKEEIRTQVTLSDGETVVLGGVFQHQKQQTKDKIPLLADIPIIGHLFKRERNQYKQRELVIFITPNRISG
ncbi:secretin N-terminal domain-containing protein [Biostraticola tofi]|uniref:Protein transport protein HofQ n=1 Tax=Biostraticola tofi TaxID=466109 RepID=A0A4R3YPY7_9GAMM|nr:secretin N-terminal domain-containing protein [Biostraticola tofi]TCV93658.1 protein transport protein HofQ [Biostraticola tofi]